MPTKLDDKRTELKTKQDELADIFKEAGDEVDLSKVTVIEGDAAAKASEIVRRNHELSSIGKELNDLEEVAKAAENTVKWGKYLKDPVYPEGFHGPGGGEGGKQVKSFGHQAVELPAFKEYRGGLGPISSIKDIGMKALFQTYDPEGTTPTGGWPYETTRTGRVVMSAERPIQVLDVVPQLPTAQAAVVYMEETGFTNAAAEIAQGASAPEATLLLEQRSSSVKKVAVFLPVTDEQLEDVEGIAAYINGRLIFMLRQRVDSQILNGDGAAANLLGILNVPGIGSHPKAADTPIPSTIHEAITIARVTGRSQPNIVLMHPNDWQKIRLLQDSSGMYIMGPPALALERRIWGYPVIEADALAEGTALTGDFANFCAMHDRRDVEIQVGNQHADYFIRGQQAIKADLRAAFVVYRPTAYCRATGLA